MKAGVPTAVENKGTPKIGEHQHAFNIPDHRPCPPITGRSLNRQPRNGSAAERDQILSDLRGGQACPHRPNDRQLEHLVAACLVGAHRPPDENKLRACLDRKADRAVERSARIVSGARSTSTPSPSCR